MPLHQLWFSPHKCKWDTNGNIQGARGRENTNAQAEDDTSTGDDAFVVIRDHLKYSTEDREECADHPSTFSSDEVIQWRRTERSDEFADINHCNHQPDQRYSEASIDYNTHSLT